MQTSLAASSKEEAVAIGNPLFEIMSLPSATLVPSRRTTRGTLKLTLRAAATIPLAIVSHFIIPPNMFTRIALTRGSDCKILNASVTCASFADPPTSRKLAGDCPFCKRNRVKGIRWHKYKRHLVNNVHSCHSQASAVNHAADVPVKSDVIQIETWRLQPRDCLLESRHEI